MRSSSCRCNTRRSLDTNREGALSYRDQLLATGAAQPRSVTLYDLKGQKQTTEPEKFMPAKSIERVLIDVDIARLAGAVEMLTNLGASIQSIKAVTIEHVGFENAIQLPKLATLVDEMTEFLRAALREARPVARAAGRDSRRGGGGCVRTRRSAAPTAFASRAEVDAALASAFGYFATSEPTSPALLLIRPGARNARQEPVRGDEAARAAARGRGAGVCRAGWRLHRAGQEPVECAERGHPERAGGTGEATRGAAIALIDAVAAHMQKAEPSSPVPYLLDRARNLATRDFVSLLQDLLSDEAIAALKKGK